MALKTTVITGATSGIGKETARALAQKGHAVYMLVRNIEKGEQVKQLLVTETGNKEIFVIECNLADMQSVRNAADTLKSKLFGINVLINNAGGIVDHREETKDGFEMTFAQNHLGHFLLTTSLMELLQKGQARIINVSSNAYKMGRPDFDDLQLKQSYSAFKAYGNVKLFNIYFTKSLAEKYGYKGINAFALHPGIVKTGFGVQLSGVNKVLMLLMSPFMINAKKGAKTSIYLATAPGLDATSGQFFLKKKVVKTTAIANDANARNKLWEMSEKLLSGLV